MGGATLRISPDVAKGASKGLSRDVLNRTGQSLILSPIRNPKPPASVSIQKVLW